MIVGGQGDDPITDIVTYRLSVLSPAADVLIAEIDALGGRTEIEDRYGFLWYAPPSFKHELGSLRPLPSDLEGELRAIRNRLEGEARAADPRG